MVTLEQIRQLDARVNRAVEMISKLREENSTLRSRLTEYQGRIEELEVLISNFKEDQSEIEHGITSALSQLAAIDDSGKPPEPITPTRPKEEAVQPPSPGTPSTPEPPKDQEVVESASDADGEDQDAELDIF